MPRSRRNDHAAVNYTNLLLFSGCVQTWAQVAFYGWREKSPATSASRRENNDVHFRHWCQSRIPGVADANPGGCITEAGRRWDRRSRQVPIGSGRDPSVSQSRCRSPSPSPPCGGFDAGHLDDRQSGLGIWFLDIRQSSPRIQLFGGNRDRRRGQYPGLIAQRHRRLHFGNSPKYKGLTVDFG